MSGLYDYMAQAQSISGEIDYEIERQKVLYPNPAEPVVWTSVLTEELGEVARAQLRNDDDNYREELVQLAAAAIRAIVDLDNGMKTEYLKKR